MNHWTSRLKKDNNSSSDQAGFEEFEDKEKSNTSGSGHNVSEAFASTIKLVQASEDENHSGQGVAGYDSRFEILSLIGSGGSSTVYKARDTLSGKIIALKKIKPELLSDDKTAERFKQEASSMAALDHQNIVRVHEYGQDLDGNPFLVMDFVNGVTLARLLQQKGALSVLRTIKIIEQIAIGLSYAHGKGLIHRDIKPSNILITKSHDGEDLVQIVDFGIARILEKPQSAHMPLTETGELLGTPWYMSPEQCFGKAADPRTDIYQVGCVFYELLSAKKAFEGTTSFEVMYMHVTGTPELSGVPEDLKVFIAKCLQKNSEDRFQNMREFGSALDTLAINYAGEQAIDSKRRTLLMGAYQADSLSQIVMRRVGANLIDAAVVGAICMFAIYFMSAFNLLEVYKSEWTGMPDAIRQAAAAFSLGVINTLSVLPSMLLSVIPQKFLTWDWDLTKHIPGIGYMWNKQTPVIPLVTGLVAWLYWSLFESSKLAGTPGKILCGLKVKYSNSIRPTFIQTSKRYWSRALTAIMLPQMLRVARSVSKEHISWEEAIGREVRMPLHDRLNNSVVMSTSRVKEMKPTAIAVAATAVLSLVFAFPWIACATKNYDLALFLNPGFSNAYEMRGTNEVSEGKFAEAAKDFAQVNKLNPDRGPAYEKHAAALYQLGDLKRVEAVLESGISKCSDTDKYKLQSLLARVLVQGEKDYLRADPVVRAIPSHKLDLLFNANLAEKLRSPDVELQYKVANDLYSQDSDLFLHPEPWWDERIYHSHPDVFLNQAIAENAIGRPELAIKLCGYAIKDVAWMQDHLDTKVDDWFTPVAASSNLLAGRLNLVKGNSQEGTKQLNASVDIYTAWLNANTKPAQHIESIMMRGSCLLGRSEAYALLGKKQLADADQAAAAKLGVLDSVHNSSPNWHVF